MNLKKMLLIAIAILIILCLVLAWFLFNNEHNEASGLNDFDTTIFVSEDFYFSFNSPEYISANDRGRQFFNNVLTIIAEPNVPRSSFENLAQEHNAEITSYVRSGHGDSYRFTFARSFTYEELQELSSQFRELDIINFTKINTIVDGLPEYFTPNDRRWDSWDMENPRGNNWGLETVRAPIAWTYRYEMDTVGVLVFDAGFYANHEDLIFEYDMFRRNSHGTHVAGIIGACFDNEIGISGIAPNSRLYGFHWSSTVGGLPISSTDRLNMLQYYVRNYGVRVINISMNWGNADGGLEDEYLAFGGNAEAIERMRDVASYYERRLLQLIGDDYEFVVVTSAGNRYASHGLEDVTKPLVWIQNEEVRGRIITVGATQQNGDLATFSQRGRLMDVSAPGVDIYSTYRVRRNWLGREIHEYESEDGTSMASPFVAGLATMIFGINPDLTGAEVKEIIVSTAEGRHNTINAGEAVRMGILTTIGEGAVAGANHALGLEIYAEILEQYQRIVENEYFMDWEWLAREMERQELSIDWLSWLNWQASMGDGVIPAYFAFYDITGNGIPELILGLGTEYFSTVLGIYTWIDGETHLLDINPDRHWLGERSDVFVLRNGVIANSGSGSAFSGGTTFYQISSDGRSIEILDELWHDLSEVTDWDTPWGDEWDPLFYDWEPPDDRRGFFRGNEQITEEEHNDIMLRHFGAFSGHEGIASENELVFEWNAFRTSSSDNIDVSTPEQERVEISDNWQDWFSISFGEWFGGSPPEAWWFKGSSEYDHPTDGESTIIFFDFFFPEQGETRPPTDYPIGITLPVSRILGRASTSVEELRYIFGEDFSMEHNAYWNAWDGRVEIDGFQVLFLAESEHDTNIRFAEIWRQ